MLSIHLGSRAAFGLEEQYSQSHVVSLGGKLHTSGIGMFDGVALGGTTFTLNAIHDP